MSDGWFCEKCETFYNSGSVHTKITVAIEPREYVAPSTFCSIACLEESMDVLKDEEAWAKEHDESQPAVRYYLGVEDLAQ